MQAPPPARVDGPGVRPKEAKRGFRRYRWEFKDSNRVFWTMGHAEVKILNIVCMVAALQLFETVATHPILILLLTMEVSIFAFFIFLYTFAIDRYMPFISWPITEILNDLFIFVFMIGGIIFAAKVRRVMPPPYIGAVILMVISAILALVDLYLQKKHLKGKKIPKSAVGHRILSVLMETITKEEEMRIRKANEEFENEEKERRRREKKK